MPLRCWLPRGSSRAMHLGPVPRPGRLSSASMIFSGSLYLLVATGQRWLGAVTPIGGLALIAGWLLLALAAFKTAGMSYRALQASSMPGSTHGVAGAGPGVVLCRRGCSACCFGPFDISPADAELVAKAVDRLEPAVRSLVELRATEQVTRYADAGARLERPVGCRRPWRPPLRPPRRRTGETALSSTRRRRRLPDLRRPPRHLPDDRARDAHAGGRPPRQHLPDSADERSYAALDPTLFDLEQFESAADGFDDTAGGMDG